MSKRLCAPHVVNWWQKTSTTMHVFLGKSKCIDIVPGAYHDGQEDPASTTKWDWSKLPQSRFDEAKDMINNADFLGLVKLNNEYLISGYHICCDSETVLEQFVNAVRVGFIW